MPSVPLTSIAGSGVRAWVSGATYAVGEQSISLSNYQVYARVIAGAGTTDPSADGTNWKRLFGFGATKKLGTGIDAAGFSAYPIDMQSTGGVFTVIRYTSGSLTANTLATMFSFSGAISVSQLAFKVNNATARTMRIRIVVDGIDVFNRTSNTIATINHGVHFAGISDANSATGEFILPPIVATESLLIQWASSLTEASAFEGAIIYQEIQ